MERESSSGFVKHFSELRVYRQAFEAAMEIFTLSKSWPAEERYSLTDQVRRSSRSVCANLAEAWHKRRYPASFISKLADSDSEAAETQNWLRFAVSCGYMSDKHGDELRDCYETISRGLVNMMRNPERWSGPSTLTKETDVEYSVEPEEDCQ